MASAHALLLGLLLLLGTAPVGAERGGVGAGIAATGQAIGPSAKLAQVHQSGNLGVIAIFASFAGEAPGDLSAPDWATDLFDPDRPGSVSHFYDDMSFGKLAVRGDSAPRLYASDQSSTAYLARDATSLGKSGQFCLEILQKADVDIDFSRYDNDGPDGLPNSGDDDGVVDVVVLMLRSVPARFLVGPATGRANLGLTSDFVTDDPGVSGSIRVGARQGIIQQAVTYDRAAATTCHELGHLLGLPDLNDLHHLAEPDLDPSHDAAGIGAWGLMGWGMLGWNGGDGPNSFSGWSRAQLGWTPVSQIHDPREAVRLDPVGSGGGVYKIPIEGDEHFLLEYRTRSGSYYDRNIPAEGVLIWHVSPGVTEVAGYRRTRVDLECADGQWTDAGYPLGTEPDPNLGGDNLDFWAHDDGYSQTHAGNLGDATDPFDGVSYTA